MNKKVSVIIPAYNCSKYIGKCIESLQKSSYVNIEIIVINDGSTDSTKDICLEYEKNDSRIKVVDQENYGPSYARNIGLKNAEGDYIVFVDSDDIVSSFYIEHLVSLMGDNDTVLAQTGHMTFLSDDELNMPELVYSVRQSKTALEAFKELWGGGKIDGYLWNKIYSRVIITENNIWFCEESSVWEDSLFIFEYLHVCKGVCIYADYCDYYYRENENSITHRNPTVKEIMGKVVVLSRICDLNNDVCCTNLDIEITKAVKRIFTMRIKLQQKITSMEIEIYKNILSRLKRKDKLQVCIPYFTILFKRRLEYD